MATEGTAVSLTFNQFGDFCRMESPGSSSISVYPVVSEPLHVPLAEWIRLDLDNGNHAFCLHNYFPCDCLNWSRDDWPDDLTFTLSFDQHGNFIHVQFADSEPKAAPDHNMMKGAHGGHPVASRCLGELVRLQLEGDHYAFYYHRPT